MSGVDILALFILLSPWPAIEWGNFSLLFVAIAVAFAIWLPIALTGALLRTRLVKALVPPALVCASIGLLVYLIAISGFSGRIYL